ncbi:MAG: LemA family protein [Parcubacteria group bacterium]|nr:LemA family protein [Parcubacteria group bacterium]
MTTLLWIILAVMAVLILAIIAMYNSLIRAKVRVDEAWSDIDVQLKRRYDLIPNLVETVKGYAAHEKETLDAVVKARNQAMQAGSAEAKAQAENALSQTLKSIFALAESYPNLKANENFLELQRELTDTENKIQAARRFYNGNARDFNTKLQVFPTNIMAGLMGFTAKEFFGLEDEKERENVQVKF